MYEGLIRHEAFFSYDDYFTELAPEACHGCLVLNQLTSSFALDVMTKLAKCRVDGSFLGIDYSKERQVLPGVEAAFKARIANCSGPTLADRDISDAKQRAEQTGIFTTEFLERSFSLHLPLREVCGIPPET